jgi:ATP-dependent phosphofructokinase / diphosphate-dependent phosphofructokinase
LPRYDFKCNTCTIEDRRQKALIPLCIKQRPVTIVTFEHPYQIALRSLHIVGTRTISVFVWGGRRIRTHGLREQITEPGILIFQSGGPTTVLNASLVGAVRAARGSSGFRRVLGARCGVEGILNRSFIDLTDMPDDRLDRLTRTPSAALGTTRLRPDDGQIEKVLEILLKLGIVAVVGIGGNDTADTSHRLSRMATDRGVDLRVINVPKTIDNDLYGTDHALGYGSAARFIALAVRDAAFDTRAMAAIYPVKIVEVMGRNAGWLAAAGTLAFQGNLTPPLVCLPECPLESLEDLAGRVNARIQEHGFAVLVVPETMRWANGEHVAGGQPQWVDTFGHPYYGGAGSMLAHALSTALNVRARYDKPGTIARMAMNAVSEVDLDEALQAGCEAVRRLEAGETGVMISLERHADDPYAVGFDVVSLDVVANKERRMPESMIDASGTGVTREFRLHALPLLGAPVDEYEVLY